MRAKVPRAAHVFGLNVRKLKYNGQSQTEKTPQFSLNVRNLKVTGLNVSVHTHIVLTIATL